MSTKDFPAQREQMGAMQTARKYYENVSAERLVRRGVQKIPPPPAIYVYTPGEFVFFYREGLKQYTGPHPLAPINGKYVRIHLGNRIGTRPFNISQIRPANQNWNISETATAHQNVT